MNNERNAWWTVDTNFIQNINLVTQIFTRRNKGNNFCVYGW